MSQDHSSSTTTTTITNTNTTLTNSLQARTYAVIPMTSRVGLLEWVNDTKPLRTIITEEMVKNKRFLQANPHAVCVIVHLVIYIVYYK